MVALQVHTLTALFLSLTLPLSPCLIFIIKILFLISMDFLPRAATALTPLTRTYNVLNIQIKIFSLSSFLQHVKLFLQSTTKPTPPTPSVLPFPLDCGLACTNITSYADALKAPATHPASLSLSHSPPPCSCFLAITKVKDCNKGGAVRGGQLMKERIMGKGSIKGRLGKDKQAHWDKRSYWQELLKAYNSKHTHTQMHTIYTLLQKYVHMYASTQPCLQVHAWKCTLMYRLTPENCQLFHASPDVQLVTASLYEFWDCAVMENYNSSDT